MNITFKQWNCTLRVDQYSNGRPCLRLFDRKNHSPVAVATVNIPDADVPDGCVTVKDYSENEGMLDALIAADIVGQPVGEISSGFVRTPVCPLLIDLNRI